MPSYFYGRTLPLPSLLYYIHFEKISPEEKTIDEVLNNNKDVSTAADNDIFNLIDSMYEGDE